MGLSWGLKESDMIVRLLLSLTVLINWLTYIVVHCEILGGTIYICSYYERLYLEWQFLRRHEYIVLRKCQFLLTFYKR